MRAWVNKFLLQNGSSLYPIIISSSLYIVVSWLYIVQTLSLDIFIWNIFIFLMILFFTLCGEPDLQERIKKANKTYLMLQNFFRNKNLSKKQTNTKEHDNR